MDDEQRSDGEFNIGAALVWLGVIVFVVMVGIGCSLFNDLAGI